jgi:hypothetical protein
MVRHAGSDRAGGAVFGAATGDARRPRLERGAAFGVTVWLRADEIAMPMLRLSGPTTERAFEKHLQSMAAHLVFGSRSAPPR